jgi:hypothetical protein
MHALLWACFLCGVKKLEVVDLTYSDIAIGLLKWVYLAAALL